MKRKKKTPLWRRIWQFFSVLFLIGALLSVYYAEQIVTFILVQYGAIEIFGLLIVFLILCGIGLGGVFDLAGKRRCLRCLGSGYVPALGGWASEYDAETCSHCGGRGYES